MDIGTSADPMRLGKLNDGQARKRSLTEGSGSGLAIGSLKVLDMI